MESTCSATEPSGKAIINGSSKRKNYYSSKFDSSRLDWTLRYLVTERIFKEHKFSAIVTPRTISDTTLISFDRWHINHFSNQTVHTPWLWLNYVRFLVFIISKDTSIFRGHIK